MEEDFELVFRPVTSGLGFHPFSDGMPYAPVSQNATARTTQKHGLPFRPLSNMGSGAVAAGTPTFVTGPVGFPSRPVPRVSVPVATAAQNPAAARATEPVATTIAQPTFGFVYLLKRCLAYGIDSGINLGLGIAALSAALMEQSLKPELLLNPGIILVSALFFGFFNWAIITAQEVAFGTSIGKRLFRLAVSGPASAVLLRAFFFLPSAGCFGAGLLWSVLDRRKRCWHDLIVDLQPSEIARL
ncbi:MAG: RDD family protein [Oligoflexia bacterium]|nr:RDD family protein [Oligoflexia bacterium]